MQGREEGRKGGYFPLRVRIDHACNPSIAKGASEQTGQLVNV